MPVTGRKPKPEGQKRNRNPPVHQFLDIPDVPFVGAPKLPAKDPAWKKATREWWRGVARMPHCILWSETDWRFAVDAARLYEEFLDDPVKCAPAMLAREKVLGTTADFRRDLRIRYVDPTPETGDDPSVAMIDEYRARLARDDEATAT